MAPICNTFVQNGWKKDLCSNCFKTQDEHGSKSPPNSSCYNSLNRDTTDSCSSRKHPITSSILNDSKKGEKSLGDSSTTPQSRYLGVANTRIGYHRNYYNYKSRLGDASEASGLRSPSLIFKSDSNSTLNISPTSSTGLRSPGLIKGLSSTDINDSGSKIMSSLNSGTTSSSTSSLSSTTSASQIKTYVFSTPTKTSTTELSKQTKLETPPVSEKTESAQNAKISVNRDDSITNDFRKKIEERNKNELIRQMNIANELNRKAQVSAKIEQNDEKEILKSPEDNQSDIVHSYEYSSTEPGKSSPTDSGVPSVNVSPDINNYYDNEEISSQDSVSSNSSEIDSMDGSTDSDDHCDGFYSVEGIEDDLTSTDESENGKNSDLDSLPGKEEVVLLDKEELTEDVCKLKRSVDFDLSEMVIGYGGDDDYSDENDFYNPDRDDDTDSLESFELTDREKLLKRLTFENTDFNAENDNLDEEVQLPDRHSKILKQFDEANSNYCIYEDMNRKYSPLQKAKVKGSYIFGKSLISNSVKNTGYSPKVNPVLPMKNGELIRTGSDGTPYESDIIPLAGIKPKYVTKDQEIKEKSSENSTLNETVKHTSFGIDEPVVEEKVTSFGSVPDKNVSGIITDSAIDKVTTFSSKTNEFNEEIKTHVQTVAQILEERKEGISPVVRPARQKKKKTNVPDSPAIENKLKTHSASSDVTPSNAESASPNIIRNVATNANGDVSDSADRINENGFVQSSPNLGNLNSNPNKSRSNFMAGILTPEIKDLNNSIEKVKPCATNSLNTRHDSGSSNQNENIISETSERNNGPVPTVPNSSILVPKISHSSMKPVCAPKPASLTRKPPNNVAKNLSARFAEMKAVTKTVASKPLEEVYNQFSSKTVAKSPKNESTERGMTYVVNAVEDVNSSEVLPTNVVEEIEPDSLEPIKMTQFNFDTNVEAEGFINVPKYQAVKDVSKPLAFKFDEQVRLPAFQEVNLHDGPSMADVDSYSSFTDDFDDDDDEEEYDIELPKEVHCNFEEPIHHKSSQDLNITAMKENEANHDIKRSERSASATPFSRNSVNGPTTYDATAFLQYLVATSSTATNTVTKKTKNRSQSCPRDSDNAVNGKASSKTSKFAFMKSSFFRPSSPPPKPSSKESNEGAFSRGRDRTKKASKFSLKKFWKIGTGVVMGNSKEDDKKIFREAVKNAEREAKKSKLNIIHPLDYNQTGVEVISRPEKTKPTYENSSKSESTDTKTEQPAIVKPTQTKTEQPVTVKPILIKTEQPVTVKPTQSTKEIPTRQVSVPSVPVTKSTTKPTSHKEIPDFNRMESTGAVGSVEPIVLSDVVTSPPVVSNQPNGAVTLRKNSSFHSHDKRVERRPSNLSISALTSRKDNRISCPPNVLGYNSEGKPKPPPPPRKTSLETKLKTRNQETIYHVPRNQINDAEHSKNAPSNQVTVAELLEQRKNLTSPSHLPKEKPKNPTDLPPSGNRRNSEDNPKSESVKNDEIANEVKRVHQERVVDRPSFLHNNLPALNINSSNFSPTSSPIRPKGPPIVPNKVYGLGVTTPRMHSKDLVYANLGDVRAPFTPRKPDRVASVKREAPARPQTKLPIPPHPKSDKTLPPVCVKQAVAVKNSSKTDSPHHDYETISCSLEQWLQHAATQGWGQEEENQQDGLKTIPEDALVVDKTLTKGSKFVSSDSSIGSLSSINPKFRIALMAKECPICDKLISNCLCTTQSHVQEKLREHDYETIDFNSETDSDNNFKQRNIVQSNSKRLCRNRKGRLTPKSKPQKYGAVNRKKIKRIRNSYYKIPTVDTQKSAELTDKAIENRTYDISSGYSSRCSSVSSNSSSSLTSNGSNILSSCPSSTIPSLNIARQRSGIVIHKDEELWIPEQKTLSDIDCCRLTLKVKYGGTNLLASQKPDGKSSKSTLHDENHQNNENIEISNGVTISKYLTGLQSLYNSYKIGSKVSNLLEGKRTYESTSAASLESLTRMMKTINSSIPVPSSDYDKVAKSTKSWQDIALNNDAPSVKAGHRVYQHGQVFSTPVTVLITPETTLEPHHLLGPNPLAVLREDRVGGTVWVLPRLHLYSFTQYRDMMDSRDMTGDIRDRDIALILLQLVTAFKQLQAQGIEEASQDLLLLAEREHSPPLSVPRLVVNAPPPGCPFPLPSSPSSLCQVAVTAAESLGVTSDSKYSKVFEATIAVLRQERAGSLTKAQSILEVFSYGPPSHSLNSNEESIQNWLEGERVDFVSRVTNGHEEENEAHKEGDIYSLEDRNKEVLVRKISLKEKYQMMFLVKTNTRSLVQYLNLIEK